MNEVSKQCRVQRVGNDTREDRNVSDMTTLVDRRENSVTFQRIQWEGFFQ